MTDSGASSSASSPASTSSRREPAESSRRGLGSRQGLYACVFWLGGQRYALDAMDVLEAITLSQLVPVPLSPRWLLGLTSLRGTPLPMVDLPVVLDLPVSAAPGTSATGEPALVLRVDGILFGCHVDRLEAVYAFEESRFEPRSAAGEHPAVGGLLEAGRAAVPATLLDHAELSRRVNELRFRPRWEHGSEGETENVAKD